MPLFGGPPDVAKLAAKGDIPGLARALDYAKDHGEVQRAAVEALCQSADARAVEPLIAALGYRYDDQPMRMSIVVALGRLAEPRAVEPLVAVLRSRPAGDMRNAADRALAQREGDVRNAAAHSLAQIGSPAVKPLIGVLGDKDGDRRADAAGALVEIGGSAVEPLIAALEDTAGDVVVAAIDVLGRIGDPRAVEPLVALNLDDPSTRTAAVRALERLSWDPGRSAAGAIYWSSRGEWDRCVQLGAPAVEPLIAVLGSRNDADGWGAHARSAAAGALGRMGDSRAVEPLVVALEDQEGPVRKAAAEALDRLAWGPDSDEAGAAYWAAKGDWDKCVGIGTPAVRCLIATLDDADESGRTGASLALGEIGAPAVEPLAAILKGGGERGSRAGRVLGMIDDDRIFDLLFAALGAGQHRDVRKILAEELVALYRSGRLDAAQKAKLLAQREAITASHRDFEDPVYQPGCYLPGRSHTDQEGLGVDFPL